MFKARTILLNQDLRNTEGQAPRVNSSFLPVTDPSMDVKLLDREFSTYSMYQFCQTPLVESPLPFGSLQASNLIAAQICDGEPLMWANNLLRDASTSVKSYFLGYKMAIEFLDRQYGGATKCAEARIKMLFDFTLPTFDILTSIPERVKIDHNLGGMYRSLALTNIFKSIGQPYDPNARQQMTTNILNYLKISNELFLQDCSSPVMDWLPASPRIARGHHGLDQNLLTLVFLCCVTTQDAHAAFQQSRYLGPQIGFSELALLQISDKIQQLRQGVGLIGSIDSFPQLRISYAAQGATLIFRNAQVVESNNQSFLKASKAIPVVAPSSDMFTKSKVSSVDLTRIQSNVVGSDTCTHGNNEQLKGSSSENNPWAATIQILREEWTRKVPQGPLTKETEDLIGALVLRTFTPARQSSVLSPYAQGTQVMECDTLSYSGHCDGSSTKNLKI